MAKQLKEFAHPEYIELGPDYQLIRDCFIGSRAVKEAGKTYLPQLGAQTLGDYDLYRKRALFFPITGKTVSTLIGFATTKDPEVTYPSELSSYFKDDNASYQFTEFYVKSLQENLLMGRIATLIDAPEQGADLPSLVTYYAEDIVNWDAEKDGTIRWVLFREHTYVEDPNHKFKLDKICQYRWCGLADGQYTVKVYNADIELMTSTIPTFRGHALNFVPVVVYGSSGVHMTIDQPPMLDIATINISHYMSSADLEWGRHFVGLPTPVVKGVDTGTVLKIGGTQAWILPNSDADAKYLEFTGQGLQSLERALSEKISLMATMSARLVDTSTKGSEAAETVRLRYMSETASLKQVVRSTEAGLNNVYSMLGKVVGTTAPVVKLNKDILTTTLDAGTLRELFNAYFKGAINKETLVYNLRRSDLVNPLDSNEKLMGDMLDPKAIADLEKPPAPFGQG